MVKNPSAMQETWVQSLGAKVPRRRESLPPPVFLPGEFHGQRSLVGYIWGCQESEIAEQLTFKKIDLSLKFSLTKIWRNCFFGGEGVWKSVCVNETLAFSVLLLKQRSL